MMQKVKAAEYLSTLAHLRRGSRRADHRCFHSKVNPSRLPTTRVKSRRASEVTTRTYFVTI